MPICQRCGEQWTWKQTVKKTFLAAGGMNCPHCHKKQYYTSRFRKMSSFVPFIIITIIMLCNLFFGPSIVCVIALIAAIPLLIIIYPFVVELSSEEEPLW